jgi:hypothetical protein
MNGITTTVFIDFIVNVDYKLLIEVLIDNEKKKTYYYRCLIKTIKFSAHDAKHKCGFQLYMIHYNTLPVWLHCMHILSAFVVLRIMVFN